MYAQHNDLCFTFTAKRLCIRVNNVLYVCTYKMFH